MERHVHGLDVDPTDGSLYVATHSGLLRADSDEDVLQPVGQSRQDLMGFSIAAAGRFLGSGHPDPRTEGMPHQLGLIESKDKGLTWRGHSLYGQVDFHVLEAAGTRLYGVDAATGRMLFSNDGGRRWAERATPAQALSLAVDPQHPRRLVVATEYGLYRSTDEGRSWRHVKSDRTGLVSWAAPRALYLLGADGTLERSSDVGGRWRPRGVISGGLPAAFEAEPDGLYVALEDGSVLRSTDGGASWTARANP
jgi:photosystem II stability/assembly factor-like uncharacterized protein